MIECTEIAEQVYEGGTTLNITARSYANRASHGRKYKGGGAT